MIIRVERRLSVAEFLASVRREYGGPRGLRAHLRRHPRDAAAALDLEDYEYYADRPEFADSIMERAVSLIPAADDSLALLTRQRLSLLRALAHGTFGSSRELARRLGRDVRNVHGDLRVLQQLGVVEFERGPGRRRAPRLAGDSIRIEFGPSPRERRTRVAEERRVLEEETLLPPDEG